MTSEMLGGVASTAVVGIVGITAIDRISKMGGSEKSHFATVLGDLRRGGKTVETISRNTGVPTGRVQRTLNKGIKSGWVIIVNKSQATWRYSLTAKGRSALKAL